MVSLIFALKKSFIKPFGFEKKDYGSVQYISVTWSIHNKIKLWQYENQKVLKYYCQCFEYHSQGLFYISRF